MIFFAAQVVVIASCSVDFDGVTAIAGRRIAGSKGVTLI
jgi:hypothetical protein